MSYVDYEYWAEYIDNLIKKYKIPHDSILDIGAGTGSLAIELIKLGYKVDILDNSRYMLDVAKKKIKKRDLKLKIYNKDIRNFKLNKKYNLILCLHDTINYLLNKNDLKKMFEHLLLNSKENAAFIIDSCSEYNIIHNFSKTDIYKEFDDFIYIWKNKFNPKSGYTKITIEIVDRKNMSVCLAETHKNKIYSVDNIKKILYNRFKITDILDGFTFKPYNKKTEEIYFILKKP